MTVKALATWFSYTVLRTGNAVLQGGVDVKARCNNFCNFFQLIPPEKFVMEDLIQNAHALFDERLSPSLPIPPLVNGGVGCGAIHAGTRGRDEKVEQGTT